MINRGKISTCILLCFLAMMSMIIFGCSTTDDSVTPTYAISGAVSGAILDGVAINLTGKATASATTDTSGNFKFKGLANGTYTVTPVKTGYIFNPVSTVAVVSGANVTGTDFVATATSASTYSISGSVTGDVQAAVTITLSGHTNGTAVTNASGNYEFSNLANGHSYTVTPSLTGYTFSPASSTVTISGADVAVPDFVATAVPTATYSISGAVSGAILNGVTITLTGAATASATTDSSGNYSFSGLANGNYTVTPSLTGYTFSPSSTAVTVSGASVTGKNFVATATPVLTYSISGAVTGDVLSGVTITLGGDGTASTTTNASGNYSFSGIANGSYTVTPSLTGYTFSPTSSTVTVSGANITTGADFMATAVATTYTQSDLTGKWHMHMLKTGTTNKWQRLIATIDSTGSVTDLESCLDSAGSTSCSSGGAITLTIDGSGVVTISGTGDTANHATMTSNKNFIAGTSTSDSTSYILTIMQKVVSGTTYSNSDVQSQSFVYHQLNVGDSYKWKYGMGTTDASGIVTITSETTPSGTITAPSTEGTLTVSSSGVVTMSDDTTFNGFLSADKKTIVGTATHGTGEYHLIIIQIAGQTFTAGSLPSGTHFAHMLAGGSVSPAPFWLHDTITVASGVMSFSDWVSSNAAITAPVTTYNGLITATGTVTITERPTYHGQVSYDKKFTVGTQTVTTGVYSLQVNTK